MKCIKIVYRSEENFYASPKVLLGKLISEDENFVSILTGKGKSYRIRRDCILSLEDTSEDFILKGDF